MPDTSKSGLAEPPATPSVGLEQMTAGVAHDFNNLLSVILVCAGEIAEGEVGTEERSRAAEIREAAERGAELSRRLLIADPARPEEPAKTAAASALADSCSLLRRTLGPGIELDLSAEEHLPDALITPGELQRMLINLVANSRDAMPEGGTVRIRAGLAEIGPGDPALGVGWYVRVAVIDNGVGMSADVAYRAAQAYFTTKGRGAGTGLGLATVAGLARAAGGDLRIDSVPGLGTTVSFFLPAVDSQGLPLSLLRRAA